MNLITKLAKIQWAKHRVTWEHCQQCSLGPLAKKHCLGRGTLPCDVVFIGEAPGKSEDVIGEPFVGPAGQLLDKWIEFASRGQPFAYAITNLVACRPCDDVGEPNRKPLPLEVQACHKRVLSFLSMASPSLIVLVGRIAEGELKGAFHSIHCTAIPHPAYALRNGGENSRVSQEVRQHLREEIRRAKKEGKKKGK